MCGRCRDSGTADGSHSTTASERRTSSSARTTPGTTSGTRSTSHTHEAQCTPSRYSSVRDVPSGLLPDVALGEGGMIELLVAAAGGTHGRLATLGKTVVPIESVLMQDREHGTASAAAELLFGAAVDQSAGHRQAAVRARHVSGREVVHRLRRRCVAQRVSGHDRT